MTGVSRRAAIHTTTVLDKIVSFNLSDIGEGIREVVVKEWFVKEGDVVEQFENVCEVQSDKASVTITSRYDGKVVKLYHKVDDIALVGQPLADFDVEDDEVDSEDVTSDDEIEELEAIAHPLKTKVLATPAVRRVAMEHKIDLSQVTPTGRGGRILKGDVLQYLNLIPQGTQKPHPTLVNAKPAAATAPASAPTPNQPAQIVPPAQPTTSAPPPVQPDLLLDKVEPIKGVARVMVKSMTESLKIPHFSYCDEVDMSRLVALREDLKVDAAALGVKLTFMPFIIKAASLALYKYPILNATFDEPNMSIVYKPYHNISVAIHTPQGLVVPNIKNVEAKTIVQIAEDLSRLQDKGQKGTLGPDDFANGTFSISNIGIVS